jgi:ATP-dependent Clp protease ATP-binding subunit ClpA
MEKAHPEVAAILLQILDEGRVTDAKGRAIDFRHTIIILTTNLEEDELAIALRHELLDRIEEIVPFEELGLPQIEAIVTIHVEALAQRLGARNVTLELSDEAKLYLARVSMAAGSGARYVARTVSHYVSTPLSTALLRGEVREGAAACVTLDGGTLLVRAA